ncbi:serine carboxypeptidase [Marasmius fiardii PR-910]|nr:serine carboxypeptidase [Marasmius fiardii PR-910]
MTLPTFLLLAFVVSTSQAAQQTFTSNPSNNFVVSHNTFSDEYNLFTPVESLGFVSESEFTIFHHPFFPKHSARIKKSRFCDHTVNAYTGYIDIEARHLFFYFFESRSSPDEDDVIFWTNGGPGASSSLGLFMELGPCRVIDADGPKFHPESWNSNANIFFIDQPVGVGFSYAEYGESVGTTEEAAQDVAAFVSIFFENFYKFKGRPFHMAGESYGGRYLPLFASVIYDQNVALIEAGLTPINLASVMIGNGMTDYFEMYWSWYDMACTAQTGFLPAVSINACVQMKQILPRCKKWAKEVCLDHYDAINCEAATSWCTLQIATPFIATGLNPYDISRKCEGKIEETLCYPMTTHITAFLSNSTLRNELGVDKHPSIPANFSSTGWTVNHAFELSQDILHPATFHVAALLERGVRVLIYVGVYDWGCNWIGNERWTLKLEWSGSEDFSKQELREWFVDGKVAGNTRSSGKFTFATVDAAGHMVPYDKPKESLELVNRWLAGKEI